MKLFELTDPFQAKYLIKSKYYDPRFMDDKAKKVALLLKNQCQPWLSQTNNGIHFAFHGERKAPDDIIFAKRHIRYDRRPLDTDPFIHNIFDVELRKIGLKAIRSNSIFVTGKPEDAWSYGKAFVTIPIDNFYYTWCPEISDFTRYISKEIYKLYSLTKERDISLKQELENLKAEFEENVNDIKSSFLEDDEIYKIKYNTLKTRLDKKINMAIRKAYNENPDRGLVPNMREFKQLMGSFKGDDGSLIEALNSKNEVLLTCKEVYLIDIEFYQELVLKYL